jgi:hypothetical protein
MVVVGGFGTRNGRNVRPPAPRPVLFRCVHPAGGTLRKRVNIVGSYATPVALWYRAGDGWAFSAVADGAALPEWAANYRQTPAEEVKGT